MPQTKRRRVRIFWDLDQTLLDTPALLSPILADLADAVGSTPERVRADISALDAVAFSWERLFERIGLAEQLRHEKAEMCSNRYARAAELLYPGAVDALRVLSDDAEQILVTFGDRAFQRRKWAALAPVHPFFHAAHFVDGVHVGKGALMATYDPAGMPTIFVDDSERWISDCELHAPHIRRVPFRYSDAASYDPILVLARHLAG